MISLYESIFTVANSSSARKTVDVARVEDIKKCLFSDSNPILTGAPLHGTKNEGGGIDKNVYITKNDILKITKLERYNGVYLSTLIDDRTRKLFDKNNVVGIEYVPFNAERSNNTTIELCIPVKKDIDLKTSRGPFKIINSGMFAEVVIRPRNTASGQISCIKNLTLTGDSLTNIIIKDHTFDSCDFGSCKYMWFHMTSDNIRPTVLMKNCKVKTLDLRLNVMARDNIFQEWKDYLMDENGPRKDLFKRLGIDNITGLDSFRIDIVRDDDEEELCIATHIRSDQYTCDIEKCSISGLSKTIMYTKI